MDGASKARAVDKTVHKKSKSEKYLGREEGKGETT